MGTGGGAPQRGLGLGCSTPGWGEQRTRASWSGVRTGFGAHRMENGYVHHWGRGEEQRNTEGGDGLHRWRRAGGDEGASGDDRDAYRETPECITGEGTSSRAELQVSPTGRASSRAVHTGGHGEGHRRGHQSGCVRCGCTSTSAGLVTGDGGETLRRGRLIY